MNEQFRHFPREQTSLPDMGPTELRTQTTEMYRKLYFLKDGDPQARIAHMLQIENLFSSNMKLALDFIQASAESNNNQEVLTAAGSALLKLHIALNTLQHTASEEKPLEQTFGEMRSEYLARGNTTYASFLQWMAAARDEAGQCIAAHKDSYDRNIVLEGGKTFGEVADNALREYDEAENGIKFSENLSEDISNPKKRAVVLSVDINSVMNADESYAAPDVLAGVTEELQATIVAFKNKFPEKEFIVVLNTGRPAMYLWGVSEMISATGNIRQFGLAEAGGVVAHFSGSEFYPEISVDQPELWGAQLKGLEKHLLGQIKNSKEAIVEPKSSMLSIKIAERGGVYTLTTKKGEVATSEWFDQQTHLYLDTTESNLRAELKSLTDRVATSEKADVSIQAAISRIGKTSKLSDLDAETLRTIHTILFEYEDIEEGRIEAIENELDTIAEMQKNLVVNFNATAGYVDIGNKKLNKYSGCVRELQKMGYQPEEWVMIHVDDSSTGIVPPDDGNTSKGADNVYLVGVGNSSPSLREAISLRKPGQGIITQRPYVLGLHDAIRGLRTAIEQARPSA